MGHRQVKKLFLELSVVLILLFALAGTAYVEFVWANPVITPEIEVLNPQRKVYSAGEVELSFVAPSPRALNEQGHSIFISFTSFSYSLDGHRSVAISGNTTLAGLSCGSHNIVVHGLTTEGSTQSSQTVQFDVVCSTGWLVLIAVTTGVVVVICVAGLACWRKIKREDSYVKQL